MQASESGNEDRKQLELLAKIQALSAQLKPEYREKVNLKRKQPSLQSSSRVDEGTFLVPATPSPKKRKPNPHEATKSRVAKAPHFTSKSLERRPGASNGRIIPKNRSQPLPEPRQSTASATASSLYQTKPVVKEAQRSASLSERPASPESHEWTTSDGRQRDDRGVVIENLVRGPAEFDPIPGDPDFEQHEPNSRINLSSRTTSHEDLQELLRGRYYLSPSTLYSVVRLQPHRQGYDVPVDGDFITIAVVAERGSLQISRASGQLSKKGEDEEDGVEESRGQKADVKKAKGKIDTQPYKAPARGKKYVNIKLVDFGHRGSSSRGTSSGDALLSLLLFEADQVSHAQSEGQSKVRGSAVYKGGSGGAFEEMLPKMREGAVIAIMNPRVLKPYQGKNTTGSDKPHPTANILGITPTGPDTIKIIGHSKDLGMCAVKRRDGGVCGSWCDKRVSEVCEYHVLNAVKAVRSSRAEFSASTSGMTTGPPVPRGKGGKHGLSAKDFDPSSKWGLIPSSTSKNPRSDGSGATYVMSGNVVSSTDLLHVSKKKEKQERARNQRTKEEREKRDEELLKQLLRADSGTSGARNVMGARDYLKRGTVGKDVKGKGKASQQDIELDEEEMKEEARKDKLKKGAFSVEMIKRIGFDPTLRPGQGQKPRKGDAGAAMGFAERKIEDISLGPPPGPRVRSGVLALHKSRPKQMVQVDDSDSDLEILAPGKEESVEGKSSGRDSGSDSDAADAKGFQNPLLSVINRPRPRSSPEPSEDDLDILAPDTRGDDIAFDSD